MKNNIKEDSILKILNSDRELKERLKNNKNKLCAFTLNNLINKEKKIALKYYDKKLSINSCPLFYTQLEEKSKYINEEIRDKEYGIGNCNVIHIGQRKLLMTEVWFLSQYNLQNIEKKDNPPVVIYPGAASGIHILYVAKLFPNIEFHLYDMSNFDINLQDANIKPKNITLYQQLFLEQESKYWSNQVKNGTDVYLISDIRALTGSEDTIKKKENVIHIDNILQYKWIEEIRPVSAMIKWRVPYSLDTKFDYKYLEGNILLQSWGGVFTTETRLIVERPKNNKPYKYNSINNNTYEEKLSVFNNIIKPIAYFNHPLPCSGFKPYDRNENNSYNTGIGLDHCWNCTSELLIWCLYIGLNKDKILNGTHRELYSFMRLNSKKLLKLFNNATRSICRTLKFNCHSLLPYKTHKEKSDYFYNTNNYDKDRYLQDFNILKKNIHNIDNIKCFYKVNKKVDLFYQGIRLSLKDKKTNKKTDKKTNKKTDKKTNKKTNKKTDKKTDKELKRRQKEGEKIGDFFEIK